MLTKYNNYLPLRTEFIEEIEDYFSFYWSNDKLAFISEETGQAILSELPTDVRIKILKQFLF